MRAARNAKGRFTRRRRTSRRRTYRRRNYMSAGVHPRQNARRRRTYRRRRNPHTYVRRNKYLANPRRRTYRRRNKYLRNPRVLGFELPNLRDSIAAGAGFLLPPVVENLVGPYLPAMLTQNTAGRWALRLGSVAATGAVLGRFVGRREGSLALIGGGVWLVSIAVNEFLPGFLPGGGLSGQPLLGAYTSLYQVPANIGATQTAMTYDQPDRLQPTSRF